MVVLVAREGGVSGEGDESSEGEVGGLGVGMEWGGHGSSHKDGTRGKRGTCRKEK